MACGCRSSSTRSAASRQQQAAAGGGAAYKWEVTYNDGATATFNTEREAQQALAFKGGGYKMIPA